MATDDIRALGARSFFNQRKRNALLLWFAVATVEGVADFFAQNFMGEGAYQMFSIFMLVINTIFMVYWFVLDAHEFKFDLNQKWIFGLVAGSFLVAPVYFFKTRGARFWQPLLMAIGCLFLVGVCYALGNTLAEFSGLAATPKV